MHLGSGPRQRGREASESEAAGQAKEEKKGKEKRGSKEKEERWRAVTRWYGDGKNMVGRA